MSDFVAPERLTGCLARQADGEFRPVFDRPSTLGTDCFYSVLEFLNFPIPIGEALVAAIGAEERLLVGRRMGLIRLGGLHLHSVVSNADNAAGWITKVALLFGTNFGVQTGPSDRVHFGEGSA